MSYHAGLKEQNHLGWYHDHKSPNMKQCNTPTQLPIVPGKLTHFASAVTTVNTWSDEVQGHKPDRLNCWATPAASQLRDLGQNQIIC